MAEVAVVAGVVDTQLEASPPPLDVLWLTYRDDAELAGLRRTLADRLGPVSCWGVLSTRPVQDPLSARLGRQASRRTVVTTEADGCTCEVVAITLDGDAAFWNVPRRGINRGQWAALLFLGDRELPDPHAPFLRNRAGWPEAAAHRSVSSCLLPWRRLHSYHVTDHHLLDALVAEVVLERGVTITRIVPELLSIGLAFSGSPDVVGAVAAALSDVPAADESAVRNSLSLGGPWNTG